MAISITFNNVDVKQGSAAEFRNLINTNFNNVKSAFTQVGSEFDKVYNTMNGEFDKVYNTMNGEFDKVYNTMVGVKIQSTQPSGQKSGNLWFKIV